MTVYYMHLKFSGKTFSLNDYIFYPTYKKIISIELHTKFLEKKALHSPALM